MCTGLSRAYIFSLSVAEQAEAISATTQGDIGLV